MFFPALILTSNSVIPSGIEKVVIFCKYIFETNNILLLSFFINMPWLYSKHLFSLFILIFSKISSSAKALASISPTFLVISKLFKLLQLPNAWYPIVWTLFPKNITFFKLKQNINVLLSIRSIFSGILISSKLVQFQKAPSPIFFILLGISILFKFTHSLKQLTPIFSTPSKSITFSSVLLLENAFALISFTLPGIITVFSPLKLAKAPSPIDVTVLGIVTVPVLSINNKFPLDDTNSPLFIS